MLIRGLQNPFVTRSMSFSTKMSNETSILYLFYLILVPFIYFVLQVASHRVDVPAEFIRSFLCSNDFVKIMLHI